MANCNFSGTVFGVLVMTVVMTMKTHYSYTHVYVYSIYVESVVNYY